MNNEVIIEMKREIALVKDACVFRNLINSLIDEVKKSGGDGYDVAGPLLETPCECLLKGGGQGKKLASEYANFLASFDDIVANALSAAIVAAVAATKAATKIDSKSPEIQIFVDLICNIFRTGKWPVQGKEVPIERMI